MDLRIFVGAAGILFEIVGGNRVANFASDLTLDTNLIDPNTDNSVNY